LKNGNYIINTFPGRVFCLIFVTRRNGPDGKRTLMWRFQNHVVSTDFAIKARGIFCHLFFSANGVKDKGFLRVLKAEKKQNRTAKHQ